MRSLLLKISICPFNPTAGIFLGLGGSTEKDLSTPGKTSFPKTLDIWKIALLKFQVFSFPAELKVDWFHGFSRLTNKESGPWAFCSLCTGQEPLSPMRSRHTQVSDKSCSLVWRAAQENRLAALEGY